VAAAIAASVAVVATAAASAAAEWAVQDAADDALWRRGYHGWLVESLLRRGCVASVQDGAMYADCVLVVLAEVEVGAGGGCSGDGGSGDGAAAAAAAKESIFDILQAAADSTDDGDSCGADTSVDEDAREEGMLQYCGEVVEWYIDSGVRARVGMENRWRRRVPLQKLHGQELQRHLRQRVRVCEGGTDVAMAGAMVGGVDAGSKGGDETRTGGAAESRAEAGGIAKGGITKKDGEEDKKARKLQKKQEARERRAMKKQVRVTKAKVRRGVDPADEGGGADEKEPLGVGDFGTLSI
jgi:hypothetical protein